MGTGEPNDTPAMGFFAWKRRMGVHEAYHRHPKNRALHWAMIPFELWAVVKLLSCIPLGPFGDVALVVIVLIAPIYLLTEPLVGALMVLFLFGCRAAALRFLPGAEGWGAAVALVVFAVTFAAQVRVGHTVYEAGLDDTEKNLAELAKTKNPVPILLVFYYHLVELVLATGYRPKLARDIRHFTEIELTALRETKR